MTTPQVKEWKVRGYVNTPLPLASHEVIPDFTTNNYRDLKQADLTSISYTVTQGSLTVAGPTALDKTLCVFDTLQLGDIWHADAEGYNFRFTLPGSVLVGETYLVAVTFTLTGGTTFPTYWSVTVVPP